MPRFEVVVVETDLFGWNRRLEDVVVFQTEESAKAFQEAYNKEQPPPQIDGNIMIALPPKEVQEKSDEK